MSPAWSLPALLVLGWAAMAPGQLPGAASQLPSCWWMRAVVWCPSCPFSLASSIDPPYKHRLPGMCVYWDPRLGRAALPFLHPTCPHWFPREAQGSHGGRALCSRVTHFSHAPQV